MMKNNIVFEQGIYKEEFRKAVNHLIEMNLGLNLLNVIESHRLRTIFKNIMIRLFLDKKHDNKVISTRKDLRDLLAEKIWEELYDIAKRTNIDNAINIIFKRYER
jgi:hypothetical protein